jgi:hypothetical protein
MKMKTSELEGIALDWAVATAQEDRFYGPVDFREQRRRTVVNGEYMYRYSTSWAQGGPIIEQEMITVGPAKHEGWEASAWPVDPNALAWGDTMLEAAMRCYVASNLGEEVEIPEELL